MALTSEQTETFRKMLREERLRVLGNVEALHAEFGESMTDMSEENGLETHLGDQGTETFLRERSLSLEEHEEQLLKEIEAALDRMDKGTYGVCEVSGNDIDLERLEAMPWARTCIRHAKA